MALELVGDLVRESYSLIGRLTRETLVLAGSVVGVVLLVIVMCRWLSGPTQSVPSPERAAAIQREIIQRLQTHAGPSAASGARPGPPAPGR